MIGHTHSEKRREKERTKQVELATPNDAYPVFA